MNGAVAAAFAPICERLVEDVTAQTRALTAAVYWSRQDGWHRVAAAGLVPPLWPLPALEPRSARLRAALLPPPVADHPLLDEVATVHQSVLLAQADRDARLPRSPDPALQIHTLIAVPLCDLAIGTLVLTAINTIDRRPFGLADVATIEAHVAPAAMQLR